MLDSFLSQFPPVSKKELRDLVALPLRKLPTVNTLLYLSFLLLDELEPTIPYTLYIPYTTTNHCKYIINANTMGLTCETFHCLRLEFDFRAP